MHICRNFCTFLKKKKDLLTCFKLPFEIEISGLSLYLLRSLLLLRKFGNEFIKKLSNCTLFDTLKKKKATQPSPTFVFRQTFVNIVTLFERSTWVFFDNKKPHKLYLVASKRSRIKKTRFSCISQGHFFLMKSAIQVSILDIWTSTSLTSWIHHQSHDSKCLQMSLDKQVFPLVGSTTFFDPPSKITRKSHFATLRAKRVSLDNSTTWWRMKNCNHVIRSFCRTKKKLVVSWRVIVLPHAIVQGGRPKGLKRIEISGESRWFFYFFKVVNQKCTYWMSIITKQVQKYYKCGS